MDTKTPVTEDLFCQLLRGQINLRRLLTHLTSLLDWARR